MSNRKRVQSRIVIIGLIVLLFVTAVGLIGTSLQENVQGVTLSEGLNRGSPSMPITTNEFEEAAQFVARLNVTDGTNNGRNLTDYYALRAYAGAPPIIPHDVDEQSFGGNDCLQCHATGDYVPRFEAYAPIVPHPELINCNQCHVTANVTELFMESDWQTVAHPPLGQSALISSPPPVPHTLQMRENCLSCHAAPATPAEIRVSHPERESCVQCHVLRATDKEWQR